jgi:NAD-dependent deacetylase
MPLDQDRTAESASNAIARVAARLKAARAVAVITGAGISAESGVPTFRGAQGLWRSFRPEQLATPEAFARDPALVWEWYRWRRRVIAGTRPNPGHLALARLEHRFEAFTLLTQNVDGLHREAGSRHLVELHGNIWRARCSREPRRVVDQRGETSGDPVPRCSCGAPLRPDVVWFGEPLDQEAIERAAQAVSTCDVLLVVGTSAVVYPVAGLPALAKRRQALVVEVNVEDTPLSADSDAVLRGPSGVLLPELERLL